MVELLSHHAWWLFCCCCFIMYYLLLLLLCITLLWYLPSLLQKAVRCRLYDGGNAHACIDDGTISSYVKLMTRLRIFYLSSIDFIILTEVAPIKQMMIKKGTLSATYLTNNARSISNFVQPLSPTSLLSEISQDFLANRV